MIFGGKTHYFWKHPYKAKTKMQHQDSHENFRFNNLVYPPLYRSKKFAEKKLPKRLENSSYSANHWKCSAFFVFLNLSLLVPRPRKFNSSPLKMDSWKTIVSFWGIAYFQGLTLSCRECSFFGRVTGYISQGYRNIQKTSKRREVADRLFRSLELMEVWDPHGELVIPMVGCFWFPFKRW